MSCGCKQNGTIHQNVNIKNDNVVEDNVGQETVRTLTEQEVDLIKQKLAGLIKD